MRSLSSDIKHDVLSDVLTSVRFHSTILCRSDLRAPWGFSVRGRDFATFHLVLRGGGFIEVDGIEQRVRLSEGDLVFLPHGSRHTVRSSPRAAAVSLEGLIAEGPMDEHGTLHAGGGGARSVLVCGGFYFEDRVTNPLLVSLPRFIHLQGRRHHMVTWAGMTLDFLRREASSGRPGANAVITRLADILFVEALRAHWSTAKTEEPGVGVALRDPRIGRSLALMHRRPDVSWDLSRLAKEAGMSRTAFAVRFHQLLGEPPLKYATRCRMDRAAGLLRSTDAPIARVAEGVGYDSAVGFGRAFKRQIGLSPAEYRRRARSSPSLRRPRETR